jgi:hypothetical protein
MTRSRSARPCVGTHPGRGASARPASRSRAKRPPETFRDSGPDPYASAQTVYTAAGRVDRSSSMTDDVAGPPRTWTKNRLRRRRARNQHDRQLRPGLGSPAPGRRPRDRHAGRASHGRQRQHRCGGNGHGRQRRGEDRHIRLQDRHDRDAERGCRRPADGHIRQRPHLCRGRLRQGRDERPELGPVVRRRDHRCLRVGHNDGDIGRHLATTIRSMTIRPSSSRRVWLATAIASGNPGKRTR